MKPTTLKQTAYENIRKKLELGVYKPGMQISDADIASELGIGRTPIREAVLQLESEGFVEQIPRQGTFVRKYDHHELRCIFELREALEAYAASRAAISMGPSEVNQLKQLCDRQHTIAKLARDAVRDQPGPIHTFPHDLVQQHSMVDLAFHFAILRASANPFLAQIVSNHRLLTRVWTSARSDPQRITLKSWVSTWRDHHRIYRAIKLGNAEAARHWMALHISRANAKAMEYFDARPPISVDFPYTTWDQNIIDLLAQHERSDD